MGKQTWFQNVNTTRIVYFMYYCLMTSHRLNRWFSKDITPWVLLPIVTWWLSNKEPRREIWTNWNFGPTNSLFYAMKDINQLFNQGIHERCWNQMKCNVIIFFGWKSSFWQCEPNPSIYLEIMDGQSFDLATTIIQIISPLFDGVILSDSSLRAFARIMSFFQCFD